MSKKLIMMITACMLVFATTSFVAVNSAEAAGYKSGKKSFKQSPSKSNIQKNDSKQDTNLNTKKTTDTNTGAKKTGGGMMKGLLLGGLGGLLFGSLFSGMGMFGSILAGLVNILVLAGVVMLAVKAFKYFKKQRTEQVK